jgi:NAD(P)-dependent dehydrogenase (short-subunit alcohol dehydrogenase family)
VKDRVLLASGTTGIAAATAERALAAGARVFLVGLEPPAASLAVASLVGDLRAPGVADEAVRRCVERFGRVDALFNVAGGSGRRAGDGPVHECTDAGWDATLDTNLTTAFRLSRAALRQMLAQPPDAGGRRGAILHMGSVLAVAPEPEHFATHAYAASKGALIALTRSMAAYYAPHGIRVNAVAPGLVRTPMSARAQADPAVMATARARQPLAPDLIDADAVAASALFLLDDGASAVTGQVLAVDGGWSLAVG